jgi:retron-type reverse transcriptase
LNARHLPQGAPTSPALANLVAYRLDRRLAGLAAACGVTYTRYADDLTFSGGEELRRAWQRFARRVTLIAAEEGFRVNRGKTRVIGRAARQTVTGVVVNVRPNVARAEFDRLKAILTNCAKHGPATQNRENVPDFRAHLVGRVAHVAAVNSVRGRKLWGLFDRIAWPTPASEPPNDPAV